MRIIILRRTITALLTLGTVLYSLSSLQAQVKLQEVMMSDLNGKPIFIKTEYVMDGTPYFPEEYTKAAIVLNNGKRYTNIDSRVNLNDNSVIMRTDEGTEFLLGKNVSKVIYDLVPVGEKFRTVVFQRGFSAVDDLDSTTYYEVLDSGKLTLLKYSKVTYSDKRGYGEASFTRVFTKNNHYYIVLPGNIIKPLGKGKEDFLAILPDKKEELGKYIDNKKLKCKKEEEWVDLVSYYNKNN